LFVLQLLWFKTYPHKDAKHRKTKKWPFYMNRNNLRNFCFNCDGPMFIVYRDCKCEKGDNFYTVVCKRTHRFTDIQFLCKMFCRKYMYVFVLECENGYILKINILYHLYFLFELKREAVLSWSTQDF
jgi:hypothetical protein